MKKCSCRNIRPDALDDKYHARTEAKAPIKPGKCSYRNTSPILPRGPDQVPYGELFLQEHSDRFCTQFIILHNTSSLNCAANRSMLRVL